MVGSKMMLVAVMTASVCLMRADAAAPPTGADPIQQDVDKLVALYSDGFGSNTAKERHVAYGPLFGPNRKDAVAFFSVSGQSLMNGFEEYIAVFAQGDGRDIQGYKRERPYRLIATTQVGTRWARTFDWPSAKISPGQIVVKGTRWAPNDAGCCPTKPITVTFKVAAANGGDTQYPLLSEQETASPAPAPAPPAKRSK